MSGGGDPIDDNPLLGHESVPRFDRILPAHVVPAVRVLVPRQLAALEHLEATLEPTWDGLVDPLSRLGEPLGYAWGLVHHLLAVRNSPELRAAQESVQAEVVEA